MTNIPHISHETSDFSINSIRPCQLTSSFIQKGKVHHDFTELSPKQAGNKNPTFSIEN